MADNLYRDLGGAAGCRNLSTAFYARVDRDPLLRPLFPGTTLRCAVEEFAAFLVQFLGGSPEDSQRRWWLSLHESHRRFGIGPAHREAWMNNMVRALDDVEMNESTRVALRAFFGQSSAYVVNQGPMVQADAEQTERGELGPRWQAQLGLDEVVAAIRRGDDKLAASLADNSIAKAASGSVVAGILALMLGTRRDILLRYVREQLASHPELVHERYAGRTLLHEAAARGDSATARLLLNLGADPNAATTGAHTPLYCLGNECATPGGGAVVRMLVESGANVNAADGVKRSTPLHMAARRGNAEVAAALLDCGADVEARDGLGDTPLRRAVNCNKIDVAILLLSKGANRLSPGSKGSTPLQAARSEAMKAVFTAKSSPASQLPYPLRSA